MNCKMEGEGNRIASDTAQAGTRPHIRRLEVAFLARRATSVYEITIGGPGPGASVRRTTIYKSRLRVLELRLISPWMKRGIGWLPIFSTKTGSARLRPEREEWGCNCDGPASHPEATGKRRTACVRERAAQGSSREVGPRARGVADLQPASLP